MSSLPTDFTHTGLPMRVLFGSGRIDSLADELDRLGLHRVMIICTPPQAEAGQQVADLAGPRAHSVYPHATMHVPVDVADAAVAYVKEHDIDGFVSVGGGSSVGLGKAVTLETGLPSIALPTTYAGSEMTPIWGLTSDGIKRTGRDPRVLPDTVIYDPDLTTTLPPHLSATSGMNAMAHAAEALYAPDTSPIITLMATEAVRSLAAALPAIVADPHDQDARAAALYGAWLSGACLGVTTMSLHHKLCHILGGTFDLPHADVHTIVLPHVLAFNLAEAPAAAAALSSALGSDDPAGALHALNQQLGVARSLQDLGMPVDGIETVVDQVSGNPYANPREVTADAIRRIVGNAFAGVEPVRG
ncbi:maleylacetate reductase [Rhodococcus koreensis]